MLNGNSIKQNGNFVTSVQELFVPDSQLKNILNEVTDLPSLELNKIDLQWLQVLSEGWASPLKGFMREDEYLHVIHFNTLLKDGVLHNQSLAIVLAISTADKERLQNSKSIALYYENVCYAVLRNPEIYYHKKEERVARQFGTTHKNHPYIKVNPG